MTQDEIRLSPGFDPISGSKTAEKGGGQQQGREDQALKGDWPNGTQNGEAEGEKSEKHNAQGARTTLRVEQYAYKHYRCQNQ